jgi:hypothetical protein
MLTRVLVALAVAFAAGGVLAGPASADTSLPVTGIVVDQGDGTVRQAVQISKLYPGASQQAVFLLDGDHPERARRIEVGVTKLADYENECIHPETGTGDTTCGDQAGQGELSQFLDVRLAAGRVGQAGGQRTCQAAGPATTSTLAGLRQQPVIVGLPSDDGTLCVIATFAHRNTPGDNVTQTDLVQFDLRLRFDTVPVQGGTYPGGADGNPTGGPTTGPTAGPTAGADDGTEVAGVKYERPVVVSRVERGRIQLGALPRTGIPVLSLLITSVGLLGAGTVILAVVRGRRRPAEEAA